MPDLWTDLLAGLDLSPVTASEDESVRIFEGANQHLEYHRVFGDQLLGQSIEAARTTCPEKSVRSLHCLFPREGRADQPSSPSS